MAGEKGYILSLRDVSKSFGGVKAVSGVTMDIAYGERRLILGTNGAGKSTLFNLICGDLPVTSGSVTLFGSDVTKKSMRARSRMGVRRTYQATALYTQLTVRQNFYLALLGCRPAKSHFNIFTDYRNTESFSGEIEQMAEKVGVFPRLDDICVNLSHGEHRQLELGLALIARPRLLLLDEPSSGLSASERQKILHIIREMDDSITLIVIEHNMELAFSIATVVDVMENGVIVCEGTAEEVKKDEYVRRMYLGERREP